MSVNNLKEVNLDKLKKIKIGFKIQSYKLNMECWSDRKFDTLIDLLSYIHCVLNPEFIIKINNSTNTIKLYDGPVLDFRKQTKDTEIVKSFYVN